MDKQAFEIRQTCTLAKQAVSLSHRGSVERVLSNIPGTAGAAISL